MSISYEVRFVNTASVVARIKFAFEAYERQAYDIMAHYAAEIMVYFTRVQGSAPAESKGMFWTNHTFKAVQGFFAKAWQVPGSMGVTIANSTWYAEILEEGHGGRFASFPTIMNLFWPQIEADLKKLYGDDS